MYDDYEEEEEGRGHKNQVNREMRGLQYYHHRRRLLLYFWVEGMGGMGGMQRLHTMYKKKDQNIILLVDDEIGMGIGICK